MIPYKWYCNHLSKKAKKVTPLSISNSNRQFWCFMLSTLVMFFSPLMHPGLAATFPAGMGFATSQDSWTARRSCHRSLFSVGRTIGHSPDAWTEQTPEMFEHSESNPSPALSSGRIGRREMQAMLCWTSQWKAFHKFMNKDFQLHTENVKARGPMSRAYVCSAQTAMKSRQHCSEGDNELNTFLAP